MNDMVRQRQLTDRLNEAEAEYVETMQVTETEEEAQELVQRQIERSLPGSVAVVLRRNNSANRLEPATALSGSDLATRLMGAEPRSCLALRFARQHREGSGRAPLLGCTVCGGRSGTSTCEPLLVGGEVIGSVLVATERPLSDEEHTQVKGSVSQAAPMLANLRTLALAESRANNDRLTGLPNKRATEDTLKRMVAQANRSVTPLAAVMLDLDHFKQINDRFGHAQGDRRCGIGDRVVPAGQRLCRAVRGQEFLVLLPWGAPLTPASESRVCWKTPAARPRWCGRQTGHSTPPRRPAVTVRSSRLPGLVSKRPLSPRRHRQARRLAEMAHTPWSG